MLAEEENGQTAALSERKDWKMLGSGISRYDRHHTH
jgi:hypothetical protein